MMIICPALNRNEEASEAAIAEIIPLLEKKSDPFLILERDEMKYMQVLWTEGGYDLEYQEGTILEHYRLSKLISKEDVIWALQSYLRDEVYWKTKFKFEKKEIATPAFKIGHKFGYLVGKALRFLRRN
jgi:hypothetical protein